MRLGDSDGGRFSRARTLWKHRILSQVGVIGLSTTVVLVMAALGLLFFDKNA